MIAGYVFAAALSALPEALVHADEVATYEALLVKTAHDADAAFAGSPCPDAAIEHELRQPVKIGDRPDLAAMRERMKVTGCGRTTNHNVNVVRFGGSPPWRMAVGLPGESLADMALQQSTWPSAMTQVRVGLPSDCNGQRLQDVYVAARPGHVDVPPPGAKGATTPGHFSLQLPPNVEAQRDNLDLTRAWVEVWPFTVCGKDRTLGVAFIPLRGQSKSAYLFLPIWPMIEAQGPGARPAPAPKN